MSNLDIQYQINFFIDLSDITVSPENTMKLMNMFKDFNLLPNTFHEVNPTISPAPIARPRFSSMNNEWAINIGIQKISIEKNFADTSLGNLDDFIDRAGEMLTVFLSEYPKTGNRISLITQSFLPEMSSEQLNNVYRKYTNPLDFYNSNPPFEWNFRSVSNSDYILSKGNERINVITNIARIQGQIVQNNTVREFDRIKADFDINTVGEHIFPRFSSESAKEFFNEAKKTRNDLLVKVEEVMSNNG